MAKKGNQVTVKLEGKQESVKLNTKNIVIEYSKAFITRLVSQIWSNFSGFSIKENKESNPEIFFNKLSNKISRQLGLVLASLHTKNILSDSMSDYQIKLSLEKFYQDFENRSEFTKAQTEYINLKQDFNDIEKLVNGLRVCGIDLIENSTYLLQHYLRYKAALLKGLGYDVVLEYFEINNFNFIYRDKRLDDPQVRAEIDQIAMHGALKALMPGFKGDISVFARVCDQMEK